MKIEVGSTAQIFCLSDKPQGKITSIEKNILTIEIPNGILTVDADDIIESEGTLKVLNYISIKKEEEEKGPVEQFSADLMKIIEADFDEQKSLYGLLMEYVKMKIPDNGKQMLPVPCMLIMNTEKKTIAMAGLVVIAPLIFATVSTLLQKENPKELVFGSSFKNMKAGGIDQKYKHIFCVFRMKRGKWMTGIVGYNTKEDFQNQEPVWDNAFWNERMIALLGSAGIVPIKEGVGTAYFQKIKITKWVETHKGYFYEGDIIVEKLDEQTKSFLKNNNLDPNNRDQIIKYFSDCDKKLDFMDTGEGFTNLVVSNTGHFFMDRRSKTRAILEAIESVAKL